MMADPNSPPPSKDSVTFSLSGLMILITVSAIMMLLLRGMVFNPAENKVFFVTFSLIFPFCAILLVSVTLKIRQFLIRRRKPRASQTVESEPETNVDLSPSDRSFDSP